ncbi:diaminopimelate decarboxylase [Methylacidiphilum kamchatkense Kam1]|uniref:Diaminopimelate decarboxylase n=1 Tax=Methylacidiphilum kamchatkense Kam1 TaxID=1202785 RepID=A0A0C1UR14_9BACT|nr:diaminopimelate decarboxylase [Methylacidiphilum kamchatkense]KIE58288.1 diaminopimelate decarboxylase [Methylacidiphilum kamchatkense Kam1]QDQ42315.1 diaminopimelate decarboxylase [Methylacidiphilum kamchatkense Kam1]
MHHFYYRDSELYVEDVPVLSLVKEYGTPLYIYSAQTIIDHYTRFETLLEPLDHLICYAVKANSNLWILKLLANQGSGFDLVSGGELYRVLRAGGDPKKCTFAGVGKTRSEIEEALRVGIYSFIVESEEELLTIDAIAKKLSIQAPVAFRINPDVQAATHAKITTGSEVNKFGIAFSQVSELFDKCSKLDGVFLKGIQIHIGSQIQQVEPFLQAIQKVLPLVEKARQKYGAEFLDIGGGIGIVYEQAIESGREDWWKERKESLTLAQYVESILPLVKPLGMRLLVEPGRVLVGNAGILVSQVLYVKKGGAKKFIIVDAAMNDLVRPAFYDAYHQIIPLREQLDPRMEVVDVVGPVCESSDCFAIDRLLPKVQAGEYLAIFSTGAYGFSMASNYNSRLKPAEVMVSGKTVKLIRKRESYQDLVALEEELT